MFIRDRYTSDVTIGVADWQVSTDNKSTWQKSISVTEEGTDVYKRQIVIYTQFGSNNVKFQMAGASGLSCFPGLKFYVNAEFTLTNVSISASTMRTSV